MANLQSLVQTSAEGLLSTGGVGVVLRRLAQAFQQLTCRVPAASRESWTHVVTFAR
jgi:hypothetical protein